MADYWISEVDGIEHAKMLTYLNSFEPSFPRLETRHLANGLWWFAQAEDGTVIGFAGMVPMVPFDDLGVYYLKRAYVLPEHRGRGLQLKFLQLREEKAREMKLTKLISECGGDNGASQNNFIRAGFVRTDPEQKWGDPDSVYFVKRL